MGNDQVWVGNESEGDFLKAIPCLSNQHEFLCLVAQARFRNLSNLCQGDCPLPGQLFGSSESDSFGLPEAPEANWGSFRLY